LIAFLVQFALGLYACPEFAMSQTEGDVFARQKVVKKMLVTPRQPAAKCGHYEDYS